MLSQLRALIRNLWQLSQSQENPLYRNMKSTQNVEHRTAAENVNQQMSRMETEVTAIFENSLNSEKKPKKKTAKTMESKQNQRSQQSTKKVH